jgi:hypothetical protein
VPETGKELMGAQPTSAEVERSLRQTADLPPSHPSDNVAWDEWLRTESDETLRVVVLPVVYKLLLDPAPLLRRRALGFMMNGPNRPRSLEALLGAVSARSELFADQVVEGRTLRMYALQALTNWCEGYGREQEVAKAISKLVDDRLPDESVAGVLAIFEPDAAERCVMQHLSEPAATPVAASVVATFGLYHRDRLLTLLTSLARLPEEARRQIGERAEWALGVSADKVAVMAKKAGFAPPRMNPSVAEARAALRL